MLKRLLIIFILALLAFPKEIFATFDMSLGAGSRTIDFGAMELGKEKTLSARGGYEQQFNFSSDNGRTWYFKAQLLRPFTSGSHSIPAENLQWIVEEVRNGQGGIAASISSPSGFSAVPVLIYTSGGTDNTGSQVQVRLKYRLKIPKRQAAGSYTAHIRFIMVEAL